MLHDMAMTTYILTIEADGDDGIIVTFSDGTTAGYVVEELLMLRPIREPVYGLSRPAERPTIATVENSIRAYA